MFDPAQAMGAVKPQRTTIRQGAARVALDDMAFTRQPKGYPLRIKSEFRRIQSCGYKLFIKLPHGERHEQTVLLSIDGNRHRASGQ